MLRGPEHVLGYGYLDGCHVPEESTKSLLCIDAMCIICLSLCSLCVLVHS